MAETPARKRPVSASRSVAAKRPAARTPRAGRATAARSVLEDEAPSTNYALRLTEGLEEDSVTPVSQRPTRGLRPAAIAKADAPTDDSFALRLSQALEAISAAQTEKQPTPPPATEKKSFVETLNALPPIRLPIGPAIPWRIGLPLFVAAIVLMGLMSRVAVHADNPGVQLPAQQTYPVQQEAPLFAKPQATDVPVTDVVAAPPAQQQPLGVQDPGGLGIDLVDLGVKLIAVLALAYGSLMVLKKFGIGGGSSVRGGAGPSVRVISSLALAPNRSVHVVEVPGGKTLLIGATPNSVNLLADLSDESSVGR